MKKIMYSATLGLAMLAGTSAFAQLQDEKNVTITMELQPILQLNMNTPDHIDFVFDQISEYIGGITRYGATTLKVSSTVDWDLWAVGTSTDGFFWDQQAVYGTGAAPQAISQLPLELLDLHQTGPNPYDALQIGAQTDYTATFTAVTGGATPGVNSIYASNTPYVLPANDQKFICGGWDPTDFGTGGSYLTAVPVAGVSDYMYTIDYRIIPGLPAIFPNAGLNDLTPLDLVSVGLAGDYAQPGIYTMDVKYVLMENQ